MFSIFQRRSRLLECLRTLKAVHISVRLTNWYERCWISKYILWVINLFFVVDFLRVANLELRMILRGMVYASFIYTIYSMRISYYYFYQMVYKLLYALQ